MTFYHIFVENIDNQNIYDFIFSSYAAHYITQKSYDLNKDLCIRLDLSGGNAKGSTNERCARAPKQDDSMLCTDSDDKVSGSWCDNTGS